MEKRNVLIVGGLISVAITFFIIFMIGISHTWYASGVDSMPTKPKVGEKVVFKYNLDPYHRGYSNSDYYLTFQQYCPSWNNDTEIIYRGDVIGRSDRKTFSAGTKINIRDSHNKVIYVIRSGILETVINGNKILTSYELYASDGEGGALLAYIKGRSFFLEQFTILDVDGNPVVEIYRNKYQMARYRWEFTFYQPDHPAADWRNVLPIAGGKSFTDYDTCNSLYVASIVLWPAAVIGLVAMAYIGCRSSQVILPF